MRKVGEKDYWNYRIQMETELGLSEWYVHTEKDEAVIIKAADTFYTNADTLTFVWRLTEKVSPGKVNLRNT